MTVGQKLFLGFGAVLLLTVIISVVGIWSLRSVDQHGGAIYADSVAPLRSLADVHAQLGRSDAALMRTLLDRGEQNRSTQAASIERTVAEVERQIAATEQSMLAADERQTLTSFRANWSQYLDGLRAVQRLVPSDPTAATQAYFDRVVPLQARVDQDLDTLLDIQQRQAKVENDNIGTIYERDRNIIIALAVISFVVGGAVAVWITRHIAQSLRDAAASAELIAGGDLTRTIEVRSHDEIGQFGRSFNRMVEGLRELTRAVQSGAMSLADATSQISAAVTQQAAGASEQAAAVSQTTATVDEVRVTTQQATLQAQSVADLAGRALQVAAIGRESVDRSVTGMQSLRTRVESIAEQMLALSEHTQQVGEIISTVDDLADQSNLLAVNAAIEAARAGEQGRSFAVVANQVRSLADRSKSATVQVRSILSDIQRAANAAVLATEQGTKDAEEGERLVNEAGDTIQQLAGAIEQATGSAQHIAATVSQQEVGMDQVAVAMANINQATMETAASSRQLQGAAKNINDLAQQLTALTAKYKLA